MILLVIALLFLWQALGDPLVDEDVSTTDIHPWIVSIRTGNTHICGGSILSETMILTAAQCTTAPMDSLSVRVGSSRVDEGGSEHKVVQVKRHEGYEGYRIEKNLALLTVSPKIQFSENVTKVTLANKGDVVTADTVANIAGWGLITKRDEPYPEMRSTKVRILKKSSRKWKDLPGILMSMSSQTIACHGDIGSPLIVAGVQVGIVSWSYGCISPVIPKIYVDVAFYRDWIDEHSRKIYSEELEQSMRPLVHAFWGWSINGPFMA